MWIFALFLVFYFFGFQSTSQHCLKPGVVFDSVTVGGDEEASLWLTNTPSSHLQHDGRTGTWGSSETFISHTPALTLPVRFHPMVPSNNDLQATAAVAPCLLPTLPARIKCLICCHSEISSSCRIAFQLLNRHLVLYLQREELVCLYVYTVWKFHITLIDLISQLVSQLWLMLLATYSWQTLPPPPYATFACVRLARHMSLMRETSGCVQTVPIVSLHVWVHL